MRRTCVVVLVVFAGCQGEVGGLAPSVPAPARQDPSAPVVSCAGAVACAKPTSPVVVDAASTPHACERFGVNADPKNPGATPTAAQLKDVGARWVRIELKDHGCDRASPGVTSDFDAVVSSLRASGARVLLILDYQSAKGTPFHSDDPSAWAAFGEDFAACAAKAVTHFASPPFAADAIGAYEIWNEPDHGGGSHPPDYDPYVPPASYARMFAKTATAMREAFAQAAPGAQAPVILTGGLDWGASSGWLDRVMVELKGHGPLAQPDAIGVHSYGERPDRDWPSATWGFADLGDSLDRFHAIGGRPLWITEFGIEDVRIQAELISRLHAKVRSPHFAAFVEHTFVYAWSDVQGDASHPWGLLDTKGEKKGSFCAYKKSVYGEVPCEAPPPPGCD